MITVELPNYDMYGLNTLMKGEMEERRLAEMETEAARLEAEADDLIAKAEQNRAAASEGRRTNHFPVRAT